MQLCRLSITWYRVGCRERMLSFWSVWGCLHEKTRTGASFIPGWLFGLVSRLHDDWAILFLFCLKGQFMLIKYTFDSKSQTLRIRYPFQSTDRPISHRNGWSFRFYMIPLRDFVPGWNSRPVTRTGVNSRRGDSRRCHSNMCIPVICVSPYTYP